jgi:hypothetical protein
MAVSHDVPFDLHDELVPSLPIALRLRLAAVLGLLAATVDGDEVAAVLDAEPAPTASSSRAFGSSVEPFVLTLLGTVTGVLHDGVVATRVAIECVALLDEAWTTTTRGHDAADTVARLHGVYQRAVLAVADAGGRTLDEVDRACDQLVAAALATAS